MVNKSKQSFVKEVMQKKIFTINPNQTIFDASVLMAFESIGALPVVKEDNVLVGILTDRDIVTKCNALGKDMKKTRVFECMTPNPVRTVPSAILDDIMTLMAECGYRRIPVVEKDKLVGIISSCDIAQSCNYCPNVNHPDESCILIDMARGLGTSSRCSIS